MDKPAPTRQQREILAGLGQTLGTFAPAPSPYPDARPVQVPTRRKNPRALIVAASRIAADPNQVRRADRDKDADRVRELAQSIEAVGLQQPPGVREVADGRYEIVYGEGRFTAMTQVLGWAEIEVILVDAKDEDLIWHQLHENIHRTNLSPLDLAAAVRQAQERGFSLAAIAGRMSKSEPWVQKALTVGKQLGEEAWRALEAAPERPAMDAVYAVAQLPAEAQTEVAKVVAEKKLTRRETEALVGAAKKQLAVSPGEAEPSTRRTGRRKKSKPFETTLRAAGGASVTVKFRKAEVETAEVVQVLEEALEQLRRAKAA